AADIEAAIGRRRDTRGEAFTMTVEGRCYTKRADAGRHLLGLFRREAANQLGYRQRTVHAGELGGFTLIATISQALGQVTVTPAFDGAPGTEFLLASTDLAESDAVGLITRLENRLTRLEATKTTTLSAIDHARNEMQHAADSIGKPFPQAEELAVARLHAREIDEQLQAAATATQAPDKAAAAEIETHQGNETMPPAHRPAGEPKPDSLTGKPAPRAGAPSPPWPSAAERQAGPAPTGFGRRYASWVPA